MPRSLSRVLLVLTLSSATPCLASQTIVPDQSATIQIGIDSGADTVLIRPGSYGEVPITNRGVVIRGMLPSQTQFGFAVFELPVIGGFIGHPTDFAPIQLIDVHVQGTTQITVSTNGLNLVRGCRFDGGLALDGGGYGYVQSCTIFGNCTVNPHRSDIGRNTIVGGTLTVYSSSTTIVHDNVVLGPAAVGIRSGADTYVRNNYVRGCVDGIWVSCDQGSELSGNIVEDCSGIGYKRPGCGNPNQASFALVSGNVARRCGGRGFDLSGNSQQLTGNVVEDVGAEGIFFSGLLDSVTNNIVLRTGGTGISTGIVFHGVRGNTVLSAQGDGLWIGGSDDVSGNVVGRCGGRGIVVSSELVHFRVRHNTSFLNAGAGFGLTSMFAAPDSVSHNISYGNANGLVWAGTSTPTLGCNDWYLNAGAAIVGTSTGASDVAVDPQFCNLALDVVSLGGSSPLVNLPGCGLVGARPQACTVAAVGPNRSGHLLPTLRVDPQPANSRMRFAWEPMSEPAQLEIYDVAGARRLSRALTAGASEFVWSGTDDAGSPVPAGIYFARLGNGRDGSPTRVVIVR